MSINGNACLPKLAFSAEASENLINVRDFFKAQESYWISDIWITFNTRTHFLSLSDVHDSMARFRAVGVWNYTMLTLAEHERVLYVGAREHIFALDPNDISRQLRPQVCIIFH